jgi:predicted dithiol-disulfide oxidoreductase (DUF899 family)
MIAGRLVGLAAGDRPVAAVSRAPPAKIAAFKRRMNWAVFWPSSFNFI